MGGPPCPRLSQWRAAPITALAAAWAAASAAGLTLYLVSSARDLERGLEGAAYGLGATEANVHVDLLGAWPQLVGLYAAVALLPPAVLVGLWWRARSAAGRVRAVGT